VTPMVERLSITVAVFVVAWAVLAFMKRRQLTAANRASERLDRAQRVPTIVYFWSDGCSVCRNAQRPVLERMVAEYGSDQLAVITYSVDESPEIAREWGVRTLPTTFVLDSTGATRYVNNGFVALPILRRQLQETATASVTAGR